MLNLRNRTWAPEDRRARTPKAVDPDALTKIVQDHAHELLVPGAVVALRTATDDFDLAYGVRARGSSEPVRQDDHIRIGSITKTWTGTVILQLAQAGAVDLDGPVSEYLPNVPNGRNITITQLLNMRSGLFNYTEDRGVNETLDREPGKAWTAEELLDVAFNHKPYFDPDQGWHYSNTNTVLLGAIAEDRDRKPLARIFQDRLFTPNIMRDTSLPDAASPAIPDPYPRSYMYGDNVLTMGVPPALPPEMQEAARNGTLDPVDQTDVNMSWTGAAGAGISTADDLVGWAHALTSGQLLDQEMQYKRMHSFRPVDPKQPDGARYGLALAQFGEFYGHTGELPGFNTFMGNDPVNYVTLVVWTNLAPSVDGRDPAVTIARAVIDELYG
jgi:D-alanyl-D-alanine carboxypeptidase